MINMKYQIIQIIEMATALKLLKLTMEKFQLIYLWYLDGSFNPKLVKKREVILNGTDDLVISLYAKGMSVRDIKSSNFYGFELSEGSISNMTEKILDKAKEWQNRPLKPIYTIIFIDWAILKVRIDSIIKNIATYIMLGIKLDGTKEVMGMWISKDNENSIYWLDIFNEIKNRGVNDILIISTDNLPGITKAINSSFPNTQIQNVWCIKLEIPLNT